MAEKTKKAKKRRKHTITGRSLLYMILMGLLMIVGTCVAAGYRLFVGNIEVYKDYAYSYANMIASNISAEDIKRYLDLEKGAVTQEASDGSALEDVQQEIKYDPEYTRINVLLLTAASYADLRYIYVAVPNEEDLTYIWHMVHITPNEADLTEEELEDLNKSYDPLDHGPYTEYQKEAMMSVMEGKWDNSLFLNSDLTHSKLLGTAFSPIPDMNGDIVAVVGVDIDAFDMVVSISIMCLNIFLAISVILIIGMVIFYFLIRFRIIRPIVVLKKATADLVENLDSGKAFEVNVNSGDEIEALARSFEEMDIRLKQYLEENTAIISERERLSTELDLARRIQADMLPSDFPAFPERKDFDIYASMTPAKEVGGDLYDFYLLDENHLALVIADVSGKGVPAALVMMMTMIMLRNFTMTGLSPKDVLANVNDRICQNKEEMFVTAWMGILDLQSGVITAANAGHEYPMLKKPDGSFELVKDPHGLVLGGMEGIRYKEYEMKLEPGSMLFVYTDGVPEATDKAEELFGTERTLDALNQADARTPMEILEAVDRAVSRFVGEAPQFDDLTMLCIAYSGSEDGDVE